MNQRLSKVRKNLYFFKKRLYYLIKKLNVNTYLFVISIFCNSNELKAKITAI